MVALLQTLLKMEGFEVLTADIDADVPAIISRDQPDIVFMDVHLGQQSGLDVVESIRKVADLADVRIVMTSGLDMRDECLRRGANDFILKPFMHDDLINVLRHNGA